MLGKSFITLDRVIDYSKQPDGTWHGDLYHPVRLHVEGRSPSDCRYQMTDKFDFVLSEWLERSQKEPDQPINRNAGIAAIPGGSNNS
jgi:hypothetical protein